MVLLNLNGWVKKILEDVLQAYTQLYSREQIENLLKENLESFINEYL